MRRRHQQQRDRGLSRELESQTAGKRGDTGWEAPGCAGNGAHPKNRGLGGCCCPGCVCTAPRSRGISALPAWDAGNARGSLLGDLPGSRSAAGCSKAAQKRRLVGAVSLIDHGKGWQRRQHLVTCRERSGRVTGDFVARTSPARTIFAPLSIPAMEGCFLLISFNTSSKTEGGKMSSLGLLASPAFRGGRLRSPTRVGGVSLPGQRRPD